MTSPNSRGASVETALIILEILRLLPRRRFTTATHVWNALTATGYERDMRSVQRLLEQLCDHFPIERDTRGKPYGYPTTQRHRADNRTHEDEGLLRRNYCTAACGMRCMPSFAALAITCGRISGSRCFFTPRF